MTTPHETIAAPDGRAPVEALDAERLVRAIVCLFRGGFDTQEIAALIGGDEAEIANVLARLRASAGTAFLDGKGRRRGAPEPGTRGPS